MPLTDLIRYFNSTDTAGDSTLYGDGAGAAAWHDGLRLRSLFQPIVDIESGQVVGHQAFLAASRDDGAAITAEEAYAACQTAEAVVQFDRLCRTLHALNFLAQRRHAGGYLQLSVHPRHLLAVPARHGLVFEAVLKRCGLAPDDLVLELASGPLLDDQRLADAVNNYRARGYRIALTGDGEHPELFAVDIIKRPLGALSEIGQDCPAKIHVSDISQAGEFAQARQLGARLGQGRLFGEARAACVSTHSLR
ncbi:MAG: hypothetical protein H6R15_3332 [Proteobacteria bacterium]|nr:hypothetical protein [Pseudomonadota bacterium]